MSAPPVNFPAPSPGNRRPLPTVVPVSIAWHLAAGAGLLLAPALWPWWLGAVAANHGVLTVGGLLPRCAMLGPNLRRLPATAAARGQVTLTLDDGPDPQVTPRVLAMLREAGQQASFFCIGRRLREQPALARRIVDDGHTIDNHTDSHRHNFAMLGMGGLRREINAAQQTIERLTGRRPQFFRAPAGLRNPMLEPVLAQSDLLLTSWTRRGYDTVRRDPDRVFASLDRGLAGGDILLLHDGHAARNNGEPVVLQVLPRLLASLDRHRLRSVTLMEAMR